MPGTPLLSSPHSRDSAVCGCALTTDASSKASPCLRRSGECDSSSDFDTDMSLDLGIFPGVFFVRELVINIDICLSRIPT